MTTVRTTSARTTTASVDRQRNARIIAIKAAQRQMDMDDATYRAMLLAQTGKSSSTVLTLPEMARVLDYLRRSGARHPGRDGGRKRVSPSADRAALMGKVHALLSALEALTGTPHTLAYADAICKRNGWCDRVDFASPALLHRLVAALSRTLKGRTNKAAGKGGER
ncbi:MAG: regulatory protein GemA [Hydrogenophaga sp.]|jgi:phage gp16-like protein|uniref:regulatory protein GemA n=1 Tax=Hydrogenophaga sp. TaxID=1904254 RepID=UPI00272341D8|nr:regulatory protein GemA [Hydrogenophaga sp.]MDO9568081.1 regulatory protein GemA [Hydrogenophaga sp.]MDP3374364.1 regulatory protein GemA [Hydrogenophaga sp.]